MLLTSEQTQFDTKDYRFLKYFLKKKILASEQEGAASKKVSKINKGKLGRREH